MASSSSVPPVHFRHNFQNLPKKNKGKKKQGEKDESTEEQTEEEPRKGPPPPDGTSTIDLTA
ncbi:hypothetical protein KQI63_10760 [bacterium]|nr:hypothetical protein [bacterium]